ncbi:MAG: HIRAN domain-containing protein [Promethearchaeota archaeon]
MSPVKKLNVNEFYHLEIVGIYYQDSGDYIRDLPPKTELTLKPEPDNPYDSHAVSVWHKDVKLGYLAKSKNRPFFDALMGDGPKLKCILGKYRPSVIPRSKRSYSVFQPERADITIHTFLEEVDWRPEFILPEDVI